MSYIPNGDREFLEWAQNFLSMLEEFKAEAKVTDEQIQDISDAIAEFNNALGLVDQKKLESKAATDTKNTARELTEVRVRRAVDFLRVQPDMTPTILIGMGLTVDSGERTRRGALRPENLVAESEGGGRVHLEWDSGGNTSGVQYVVEVQLKENGEFTLVDVVTRRRLVVENMPTGATLTFRVKARRNGETSALSNLATVQV